MNNVDNYFHRITPVKKELLELQQPLHTEINVKEEESTFDHDIPEFTTEHTITLQEIMRQQNFETNWNDVNVLIENDATHFLFDNNTKDERKIQCNICNKTFQQANLLKRHYRMHVGENFFPCDNCLISFTNANDLAEHKKTHIIEEMFSEPIQDSLEVNTVNTLSTPVEKNFKCEYCDKVYSQLSSLKTHERIHNTDTSFTCNICQKVFSTINNFKMHERTHTGEKPFVCQVCNKCFAQRNHLQRHNRIHTGEKPYRCNICERTFSQQNNLKRHIRLHSGPFQCNVCDKHFTSENNLKTHGRIHSIDKPFKCDNCDKTFLQTNHLKRHQRCHILVN